MKTDIDEVVQKKVTDVNFVLNNLSQVYEDKMKRGALNQIEKLMNIIKASKKSIFINKVHQNKHHCHHLHLHQHQHQEDVENRSEKNIE